MLVFLPLLSFALMGAGVASSRPPACGNSGLQYAAHRWTNTLPDDLQDPTQMVQATQVGGNHIWHDYTGLNISGNTQTFWSERKPIDTLHMALNVIGYIYAPYTGTYIFNITSIDDALWFWLGDYAYSGYGYDNVNFYTSLQHYYPTTYSYEMVSGQYVPFRMVYLNTYGGGRYNMTIDTPRAGVQLSPRQLVYFGCNGAAPIFPDYNQTKSAT